MTGTNSLLNLMNKKPLTDRDEALGLGHKRLRLWENFGDQFVPFDKQVELLMSPAKELFICASRGSGKSHVAAIRVLEELMLPNRSIYLVAPEYKHCKIVFDVVYHAFSTSSYLQNYLKDRKNNKQEMTITTDFGSMGSTVTCLSASDPDALIGIAPDLVVIDEAAIMSDDAFAQLKPSLNRLNHMGRLFAISSPRGDNFFFEQFRLAEAYPSRKRHAVKLHVLDNPYADHQEYYDAKKDAERIGTAYAMAMFKREWDAEFDTIAGEVFSFSEDIWFPDRFYIPAPLEPIVIGIDYARLHDWTVCTAFTKTGKMVGFDRFKGDSGPDVMLNRITDFIEQFWNRHGRVIDVLIDATGEGSGVPLEVERRLKERYGIVGARIKGFKFTNTNKRELLEKLQVKLATEDLALWNRKEIKEELINYKVETTPAGNLIYKARFGHDDVVMSLALAVSQLDTGNFSVH